MKSHVIRQSFPVAAAAFLSLTYALVVRDLRTEHKNAALGILISIAQPLLAGILFFVFLNIIGSRAAPVRGDGLTFVLTGFVIFFLHIRTVAAVSGALNRAMMNHQRLTPFLMVCVKALGALYKNLLAVVIMLAVNYLLRDVYEMYDPLRLAIVLLGCWLGGIAVGMIFMALQRYFTWGPLANSTYVRIMFLTSGKFFVASQVTGFLRPFMEWNPLFHLLDQGRGAVFLNYGARTTDLAYPFQVIFFLMVLGFIVEHYVRQNYSASQMPGG